MAEKINGRVAYADLLRVLAVIAVIVLHVAGSQMSSVAVTSQAWAVFNVYDSLVRWAVPVFVMLSGMFMLDPRHSLPLSRLLLHNFLHIFICLIFWGMVYALADYAVAGGRLTLQGAGQALLNALQGNTHYHLWFLFMILGLYLVTPILRAFIRGAKRSDFHWFFLLTFLWVSVLPTMFKLWPNATSVLQTWYYRLDIRVVLGYVGFYVAGYYLKEFLLGRIAEALIYVAGIAGAVFTVWGTRWLSVPAGGLVPIFYDYFAPNVVALAVAIVVLFRYVLGVSEERSRKQRVVRTARLVFGIYLIHDLFITLFRGLGITTLSFNPVLSVPLLAALIFLLSLALIWPLSKIPLLGRWLI